MKLVLIITALVVVLVFVVLYRRANWKAIDRANEALRDSDGNHAYYDRKMLRRKADAAGKGN